MKEAIIACDQCGLCARVCLAKAITVNEAGVSIALEACNACGHCAGVCPTGQMRHPKSPLQEAIRPIATENAANFLRAARSIREYKADLVPKEQLTRLLDIGRYPQTGSNTQGVSYLVLEGREKIEKLNALYENEVEKAIPADAGLQWYFDVVQRQRRTGEDIVFRGCSQLVLALADTQQVTGRENAQFSLTFIALLAPTMGIGTCWAGIFQRMATNDRYAQPFLDFAQVPPGKAIRGALMVGVPDVTYARLVERDPLDVQWR